MKEQTDSLPIIWRAFKRRALKHPLRVLWMWRLRRLWYTAPDLGEFYSNVGYFVARGFLPKDALDRRYLVRRIRVRIWVNTTPK